MLSNPLFVTYGLISCIVILVGWVVRLEIKMWRLLRGKDAKSLEDAIVSAHDNLDKLNEFQKESVLYFINIEKRLNRSVQAVETIRFNPFKGTGEGGSQSFSTSFLSENGDGVVLSSLYSRDRVSVFSKPLAKYESTFELTDEEKEVIAVAKKNLER
ncbi:MAG: hypothetical protein QG579_59 [Patescibacteria group bacterium]|jgi:hypothetical protein|nr:hypothetical protein [Patescibacteria group bacterium]